MYGNNAFCFDDRSEQEMLIGSEANAAKSKRAELGCSFLTVGVLFAAFASLALIKCPFFVLFTRKFHLLAVSFKGNHKFSRARSHSGGVTISGATNWISHQARNA